MSSPDELRAELRRVDGTIVGYLLAKRSPPKTLLAASDRLHAAIREVARSRSDRDGSDGPNTRRLSAQRLAARLLNLL